MDQTTNETLENESNLDEIYQNHLQNEHRDDSEMERPDVHQHTFSISHNFNLQGISLLTSKKGLLLKKSPNIFAGWQKRGVVVENGKFQYYKEKVLKGSIDFRNVQAEVQDVYEKKELVQINLVLLGTQKKFQLKSEKDDLVQWSNVLKQNIKFSESLQSQVNRQYIISQKHFWKNERISQEFFVKEADTGDILLFKGQSALCKLQRTFTGDEYDHVGLILRYNNGQLFLFESTGQLGVGLCSWNKFMRNQWHLLYRKLVFRHLQVERSDEMVQSLEEFIKKSIGKKYKVSPGKLIQRFRKSEESKSNDDRQDKTYFCSELVAAAYKKMGLLNQVQCSASYWPGMFSQDRKLKLLKGDLQNEMLIDFCLVD